MLRETVLPSVFVQTFQVLGFPIRQPTSAEHVAAVERMNVYDYAATELDRNLVSLLVPGDRGAIVSAKEDVSMSFTESTCVACSYLRFVMVTG